MSKTEHKDNDVVTLKRRLPPEERVDFDTAMRWCSLFTGITDSEPDFRIKSKYQLYRYFVLALLYSNLIRTTIECFLPEGSPWFLYLGDFKPWWGKPYIAHQIVFFSAVLVVPVICTVNITADESMKRWTEPFKYIQGLVSAEDIGLWNVTYVRQLRNKMRFTFKRAFIASVSVHIPYTICVFVSFFLFCETWSELIFFGIPWTVYESLWTVYITTNNYGILPGAFEIICYYLRLRYQQIDELLLDLNRDIRLSVGNRWLLYKVSMKINRLLKELDGINKDVMDYNKFWSKFIAIIFISYIPQILFEFYIFLFLPMNSSVLVFSLLLNLNIFALISQIVMFSSILHCKVSVLHFEGMSKAITIKSNNMIKSIKFTRLISEDKLIQLNYYSTIMSFSQNN